jgi:hypothetical protein
MNDRAIETTPWKRRRHSQAKPDCSEKAPVASVTVYSLGNRNASASCRRGKKNSPVKWHRYNERKFTQPFAGFEVTESLLQMWGMYVNAKRTNDRIDVEQPRLFDSFTDDRAVG